MMRRRAASPLTAEDACERYELTREEFPITPGEATVDLADTAGQQLADNLRAALTATGPCLIELVVT